MTSATRSQETDAIAEMSDQEMLTHFEQKTAELRRAISGEQGDVIDVVPDDGNQP